MLGSPHVDSLEAIADESALGGVRTNEGVSKGVWSFGGLGGRDGKSTRGNDSRSVSLEPKSTGHCSTYRHRILAAGRHWANLQLLAVQHVHGQGQTRQYLVKIVLLVQIILRDSPTASVPSKTSAHPASPFLSRCLPVSPILTSSAPS